MVEKLLFNKGAKLKVEFSFQLCHTGSRREPDLDNPCKFVWLPMVSFTIMTYRLAIGSHMVLDDVVFNPELASLKFFYSRSPVED
jgi:hypothetical protein